MADLFINRFSKTRQYFYSILFVCIISAICYVFGGYIGYRVVGFILLVTVSLIAMSFDILPVLFSALFSALIWDFFFIPPHFTFQIASADDSMMLFMYFLIAMINAVLTYKIRQIEKVAMQKEEKANTVKLYNTILNSLSHELRTPIAAIIGATDNLEDHNERLTDTNRSKLVKEISKASFRLNQQVENLLNMSRLESGFIEPKKDWCDIIEVIYEVVKRIRENKITQKINVNINPAIPLFKLDGGMLEQVIYNLVNNAVLYTHANSVINIVAICHADVLKIIIEDDGDGFPEGEIGQVFDKFYRLKNSRTGGTGLGLSIVKGFIEAMNGSIYLENIATSGARFTINIVAQTSYQKTLHNV